MHYNFALQGTSMYLEHCPGSVATIQSNKKEPHVFTLFTLIKMDIVHDTCGQGQIDNYPISRWSGFFLNENCWMVDSDHFLITQDKLEHPM